MKSYSKISLFLIAFCSFISISLAQPPPPPPPPPAIPTKTVGKARIYESKKQTTAETIFLRRNEKINIRATCEIASDRKGEKPKEIQLIYQSFSTSGLKYKNNRTTSIT